MINNLNKLLKKTYQHCLIYMGIDFQMSIHMLPNYLYAFIQTWLRWWNYTLRDIDLHKPEWNHTKKVVLRSWKEIKLSKLWVEVDTRHEHDRLCIFHHLFEHTHAWAHIDNQLGCIINNQKVDLFILCNPTIITFHHYKLYL